MHSKATSEDEPFLTGQADRRSNSPGQSSRHKAESVLITKRRKKMKKSMLFLIAVAVLVCFAIQPAQAQVFSETGLGFTAFGPPDPDHGFPTFYTDTLATILAPCLDGAPNCLPFDGGEIVPVGPFPDNFPEEFFYWIGSPLGLTVPAPASITVIEFALEGAFATLVPDGAVAPNEQSVFQRIRYRVTGLQIGSTLTITHPWGQDALPVVDDGTGIGEVNVTLDLGAVALDFETPRAATAIGPYLTAVLPAPPPGYIGTCGGSQTVTGGVGDVNSLTIAGTDSDGTPINETTDLWDICGKLFAGTVREPVATFTRDALGAGTITVSAIGLGATAGPEIDVTGELAPLPTEVPPAVIPMAADPVLGAPRFTVDIPIAAADTLPANVIITVDRSTGLPGNPIPPALTGTLGTSAPVPITDVVTINSATFVGTSATAGTLTVIASSSNASLPLPLLTVADAATATPIGAMVLQADGTFMFTDPAFATPAAGASVMVTSTADLNATGPAGGTDTLPLAVTPFVDPNAPPGGGITPAAGGGGGGGCFINLLLER
jgi:hypothetical protein